MKKVILLVFVAVFLVAGTASAAQFVGPSGNNGNTVIREGTYNDLYTGGASVAVQTDVAGDLFAGGGTVTVSKNVGADLFAAGGNVNINGSVGGDLRVAGGTVSVTGDVNEDLLAAGGNILLSGKKIGGDLWVAGGNIVVDSDIAGGISIRGKEVLINGTVAGPVDVIAEKLTFGPQSRVSETIMYKGPSEAVVETGAVVSQINYEKIETSSATKSLVPIFTIAFLIKLIGMLLSALLLLKLFHKCVSDVSKNAYSSPWKSFGIGLAGIILTPVVIVLLFITIIGFYIAIGLIAAFVLALIAAARLASIFAGGLIMKWILKKEEITIGWREALIGIIALALIGLIPFIGWIIVAANFLIALGSLVMNAKRSITETQSNPS